MSDLYARLGIDRKASTEEIRRAYKDLARSKHPDKGGDVEEFKAIQEAHEVLCDEGRRRMYDMTGTVGGAADVHAAQAQGGMAAGGIPFQFMRGAGPFGMPGVQFDMGSMFGNMFGGGIGRPQRRPGKGPNKHHDIGLRLSEFYKGHEIKLKFNQARKCGACVGSGAEATETCGTCNGSGVQVRTQQIGPGMFAQSRSACPTCSGEGKKILSVCKKCNGKRFIEKEKQLDIKIVPGMHEGEQLVFSGECSDSLEYELPGDVVLTLRRVDTPSSDETHSESAFEWKGDDLWTRVSVTYAESVLGFTRTFDAHPNGQHPVYCWNGGPLIHGAVLQFPGSGMPRRNGTHGTLFIQVAIQPPPTVPWTPEDGAKLQSVLGGPAVTLPQPGHNTLMVSSSEGAKF
jgi:DnaJ-class molecular chaperone